TWSLSDRAGEKTRRLCTGESVPPQVRRSGNAPEKSAAGRLELGAEERAFRRLEARPSHPWRRVWPSTAVSGEHRGGRVWAWGRRRPQGRGGAPPARRRAAGAAATGALPTAPPPAPLRCARGGAAPPVLAREPAGAMPELRAVDVLASVAS